MHARCRNLGPSLAFRIRRRMTDHTRNEMQISGIMTLHPIGVTPNQTIGETAAIMERSDLH